MSASPSSVGLSASAQLAALFVGKALAVEPVDVEGLLCEGPDSARALLALRAHHWRSWLRRLRHLALLLLLALTVLEPPTWCTDERRRCGEAAYYSYGWDVFGCGTLLTAEAGAVAVLLCDLSLWLTVLGRSSFWRARWRIIHVLLLFATLVDVVTAALLLPTCRWRLSPYLRAPLLVAYDQALQRELRSLVRSAAEFLKVLLLLAAFVGVSAWFGAVLFTNSGPEGDYFTDFGSSFWSLEVLLTTNNFPDVMIKGYSANRAYGIFFVLYIVVGLYLLLQLVVAVVYNGYARQRDQAIEEDSHIRQRLMDAAFQVLDEQGCGWLASEQLSAMLVALGRGGGFRVRDEARQALLFAVLDQDGSGRIERSEFGGLARVLYLRFEPLRMPWLEVHAPRFWEACRCEKLRAVLTGGPFEVLINVVLIGCLVLSTVETWPFLAGETSQKPNEFTWDNFVDIGITLFFLLEMSLKALLLGWPRYWSNWQNRFDALATVGAIGAMVFVLYPNGFTDYLLIKAAVLLRFFRLLRLFEAVSAFRPIFASLTAVVPGSRRVFPLLGCLLLTFDVLGCDLFGGLITTDPSSPAAAQLAPTDFAQNGYFALNFNDRPGGAMTLFACLVMNNWNTYVDAYTAVAGPTVARLYFTLWWIVGVLLGMNLVTSVVIDAFVDRWAALNSGDGVESRSRNAPHAFDAGVITGTSTGLTGRWTAHPLAFSAPGGADLQELVSPSPTAT